MKKKIYIDGSEGTTGLRIADRLSTREDIEIIKIDEDKRKDPVYRAKCINASDITFLCLPDSAAIEAVSLVTNDNVKIIDASTAHRTKEGWVYGLPELSKSHYDSIKTSKRVAVPGCHAGGFVTLVYPLVQAGLVKKNENVSCFSLTGYSGGGKKMIAEYESENRSVLLNSPRQYGLTQTHKHLKEMQAICGLDKAPVFAPIVCDFYSGMEVTVPVFSKDLKGGIADIRALYQNYYQNGLVRYDDNADPDGMLSAAAFSGRDDMQISVHGNDERILLTARFDNLGKGASGAAIQNMNILLGIDEITGLCV